MSTTPHYADPHAGLNSNNNHPTNALMNRNNNAADALLLADEPHEGSHSISTAAFALTPPDATHINPAIGEDEDGLVRLTSPVTHVPEPSKKTKDAVNDNNNKDEGHGAEGSETKMKEGEEDVRELRAQRSALPVLTQQTSFRQREEEDEPAHAETNLNFRTAMNDIPLDDQQLRSFSSNNNNNNNNTITGSNVFTRSMFQPPSRTTHSATAQPSFASPSAAAVTIVPLAPAEAHGAAKEIHTRTGRRVHTHKKHKKGKKGNDKKKKNNISSSSSSGSSSSSSEEDEEEAGKSSAVRDDAERIRRLFARHMFRNYLFLWLLGVINNFHYNLVISAANELAAGYGMKPYVAVISFVNVFFGIFARLMNAFVAHRISYNIRMTIMPLSTLLGLLLIALSGPMGRGSGVASFLVMLLGVSFSGTAYSYGETVALTYVQRYPAKMVGAWGSGTGTSGVIASLLFIILSNAGLSKQQIFFISMPLALIYWLTFIFGLLAPHKVVTLRYLSEVDTKGRPRTRRVVLHRGAEDEMLAALQAQASTTLEVSAYEIVMLNNLRGLAWRTLPKSTPMPVRRAPKTHKQKKNSKKKRKSSSKKKAKKGRIHGHSHTTQVNIIASSHNNNNNVVVSDEDAAVCTPRSEDPMYYYARPNYGIELDGDTIQRHEEHGEEEEVVHGAHAAHAAAAVYYSPTGLHPATTPHATNTTNITSTGHQAAIGSSNNENALSLQDSIEYTDAMHSRFCRCLFSCCSAHNVLRRWWVINGPVILLMHHAMLWFLLNLAIVYVAEYAAQFMAPFSFFCQSDWNSSFWLKNSYTITQLCYQIGVLVSRSSLPCVKIPAVGVLSIIQVVNAIGWFVQAKVRFIASKHHRNSQIGLSFLLFVWMIFVGMVGGASYVNVFYLVLRKSDAMQQTDIAATVAAFLRKRGYTAMHNTHSNNGDAQAVHGEAPLPTVPTHSTNTKDTNTQHTHTLTQTTTVEMLPRLETPTALAAVAAVAAPFSPTSPASSSAMSKGGNGGGDGVLGSESVKKVKAETVVGQPAPSESSSSSSSSSSCSSGKDENENDDDDDDDDAADAETTVVNVNGAAYRLRHEDAADLKDLQHQLADEWQRRRELAMSIGALYAMVGICIGTAADVIFTNTVLKSNTNSCSS